MISPVIESENSNWKEDSKIKKKLIDGLYYNDFKQLDFWGGASFTNSQQINTIYQSMLINETDSVQNNFFSKVLFYI